MRRGMTLLEVLVSLALLSAMSIAAAGWIQVSARVVGPLETRHRWENAAASVLEHIADDLTTGDFQPGLGPDDRVLCTDRSLSIATRSDGRRGRRTYSLRLVDQVLIAAGDDVPDHVLLGNVADFSCRVDVSARVLDVSIVEERGLAMHRRYRLP